MRWTSQFAQRSKSFRRQARKPPATSPGSTPMTGAEYHRGASRRPRGLHLRRAGQGRHRRIRRSATPRGWSRASTTRSTTPSTRARSCCPTDTGNGGMTHAYFKAPKSMEDLLQGRSAIAEWARMTYGWIGRAPDYKASFLATLGANADFYDAVPGERQALVQATARSACPSSTTPSSIRRSTATGRRTRSPTSAAMSRRKPTPA